MSLVTFGLGTRRFFLFGFSAGSNDTPSVIDLPARPRMVALAMAAELNDTIAVNSEDGETEYDPPRFDARFRSILNYKIPELATLRVDVRDVGWALNVESHGGSEDHYQIEITVQKNVKANDESALAALKDLTARIARYFSPKSLLAVNDDYDIIQDTVQVVTCSPMLYAPDMLNRGRFFGTINVVLTEYVDRVGEKPLGEEDWVAAPFAGADEPARARMVALAMAAELNDTAAVESEDGSEEFSPARFTSRFKTILEYTVASDLDQIHVDLRDAAWTLAEESRSGSKDEYQVEVAIQSRVDSDDEDAIALLKDLTARVTRFFCPKKVLRSNQDCRIHPLSVIVVGTSPLLYAPDKLLQGRYLGLVTVTLQEFVKR